MRKIQKELRNAIINKCHFSKQNTVFRRMANTNDGWELLLHGNPIACFDARSKYYPIPTFVSLAGYPTITTCSRLNALDGVNVQCRKNVVYLNGKEIEADGWWSPCNLNY